MKDLKTSLLMTSKTKENKIEQEEITLNINNLSYTLTADENLKKELAKYLDISNGKNNEVKSLLIAYLNLYQEHVVLKEKLESIEE